MGVIIPKGIVEELELKPREEITLEIRKKSPGVLRELFGSIHWTKNPKKLLREARLEFESRHMR